LKGVQVLHLEPFSDVQTI